MHEIKSDFRHLRVDKKNNSDRENYNCRFGDVSIREYTSISGKETEHSADQPRK